MFYLEEFLKQTRIQIWIQSQKNRIWINLRSPDFKNPDQDFLKCQSLIYLTI